MPFDEMPIKIAEAVNEALRILQQENDITERIAANRACGIIGLDHRMCEPVYLLITKGMPEAAKWAQEVS